MTCDQSSIDCQSCQDCVTAPGKPCEAVLNTCNNSQQCIDYYNCITACAQGDQACYTNCQTTYPTGANQFNAFALCVVCQQCPINCDAAGSGCP